MIVTAENSRNLNLLMRDIVQVPIKLHYMERLLQQSAAAIKAAAQAPGASRDAQAAAQAAGHAAQV